MTATNQSDRAPAIAGARNIPGPVHVSDGVPPLTTATEGPDEPKGRRNPVRIVSAKVMSALRGDKYMVDAYPTAEHEQPKATDDPQAQPQ